MRYCTKGSIFTPNHQISLKKLNFVWCSWAPPGTWATFFEEQKSPIFLNYCSNHYVSLGNDNCSSYYTHSSYTAWWVVNFINLRHSTRFLYKELIIVNFIKNHRKSLIYKSIIIGVSYLCIFQPPSITFRRKMEVFNHFWKFSSKIFVAHLPEWCSGAPNW